MCSSAVVEVLADLLEVVGFVSLIIGFFSVLTVAGTQNKWSAGVFLLGVIALVIGFRLPTIC